MREPGSSYHPEDCQAYFSGLLPLASMSLQNCVEAKQAKGYRGLAMIMHGQPHKVKRLSCRPSCSEADDVGSLMGQRVLAFD